VNATTPQAAQPAIAITLYKVQKSPFRITIIKSNTAGEP